MIKAGREEAFMVAFVLEKRANCVDVVIDETPPKVRHFKGE